MAIGDIEGVNRYGFHVVSVAYGLSPPLNGSHDSCHIQRDDYLKVSTEQILFPQGLLEWLLETLKVSRDTVSTGVQWHIWYFPTMGLELNLDVKCKCSFFCTATVIR